MMVEINLKNLPNYHKLIEKIKKIVALLESVTVEHNELKRNSRELSLRNQNLIKAYNIKLEELETEIKSLKKENKILKEKEKTIKTKIDRLAVKLNHIKL